MLGWPKACEYVRLRKFSNTCLQFAFTYTASDKLMSFKFYDKILDLISRDVGAAKSLTVLERRILVTLYYGLTRCEFSMLKVAFDKYRPSCCLLNVVARDSQQGILRLSH